MASPANDQPAAPTAGGVRSLTGSWICAAIGFVLLLLYALLTHPGRAIIDLSGPARIGLTAAIIAGGIVFWGIFRGITGPAFTKPAVVNAILLAFIAPASIRAWLLINRAADANNLKTLNSAVRAYADDYDGHPPANLAAIYNRPGITPAHFRRPGHEAPPPTIDQLATDPNAADYLLVAPGQPLDPKDNPPLICSRPGGLGSWINVGYANGMIRGHRADSVAAATGVTGREPPKPPPLPSIDDLKALRDKRDAAPPAPAQSQ